MHRAGLTFVEILLSIVVIALLGVAIQTTMVSTVHGVQVDRDSEIRRHVTLDLLERFCHPYSDVDSLFPAGGTNPHTRELSVDEAVSMLGMRPEEGQLTRKLLEVGGVTGFSLVWHRGVAVAPGDPAQALRLDRLWVRPVTSSAAPGAVVNSFRVFAVRGS